MTETGTGQQADPPGNADVLEKLNKQLTCVICQDEYTQPKVLQCFHTFCKKCLVRLVKQGRPRHGTELVAKGSYYIVCPTCRHTTFLSSDDVSSLQSGFHIYGFKEIRDDLLKVTAPPTKGAGEKAKDGDGWVQSAPLCPHHEDKEVTIYCDTCTSIGCVECLYTHHKDHAHHLISSVIEEHKTEISAHLQPILEHRKLLERSLQPVDERVKQISDRKLAVEKEVEFVFFHIVSELEARKAAILKQLQLITDKKLQALTTQREESSVTLDSVCSCEEFVVGTLKTASPANIMHMKRCMIEQVQNLMGQLRAPVLLKPEEEANIKFSYSAEKLIDELKDFGKVYAYDACPEKCTVTGNGVKCAEVGKKASAVLQTINSRECLSEEPVESLECELVSDITGAVVECHVERCGQSLHSIYDLSYVPVDKGRHQLHLKVEGEHIRGSPFMVAVSSSERLAEPMATIHGLRKPTGVNITAQGKILVSQSEGNCVCL